MVDTRWGNVPEGLKRIPGGFSISRAGELRLSRVSGQFDLPSRPESARADPSPTFQTRISSCCLDLRKPFFRFETQKRNLCNIPGLTFGRLLVT